MPSSSSSSSSASLLSSVSTFQIDMLSLDNGKSYADGFLTKESVSARRRRLLRRVKLLTSNPHTTSVASGADPNASDASSGKSNIEPSSSSATSSTTTPFRRMDGDIRRPAGIPLSGEEIVESGNKVRGVNCASHGSISVIGRRRVMEDTMTVAPTDFPSTFDLFAVYDGHGGGRVSSDCRDVLHTLVGEQIKGWRGGQPVDWETVMSDCFRKMDDEADGGEDGRLAAAFGGRLRTVGSTALVLVLGKEEIVVANCGHSRAVLFRNGEVVPLSWDHKADRSTERLRIEAAGGVVKDANGLRVQGVLKATRSIGDHAIKTYMIAEPEVTITRCSELDDFIVLATNGLWDVVSNEDASVVVKNCLEGHTRRTLIGETTKSPAEAAAMLAALAMAKGSKDNISVIVIELKKHKQSPVS